jgi:hypothetical protein
MTTRTLTTVTTEMDAKLEEMGALALELQAIISEARSLVPDRTQLILNPNVDGVLVNIVMSGMGFTPMPPIPTMPPVYPPLP